MPATWNCCAGYGAFSGSKPRWRGLSATQNTKVLDFIGFFGFDPCRIAWENASRSLIFVHRGVTYCDAVARATVALLGRFLPRLGPLASASGPFFRGQRSVISNQIFCLLFLVSAYSAYFFRLLTTDYWSLPTPPPPDRAAAPLAEFRPAGSPASPDRPPNGRNGLSARSGARPCRGPG